MPHPGAPVPGHELDDQIYRIFDVKNPAKPTEVGRWWLPGTKKGETPIERVTGWDTPYPHAQEWAYFPGPARVGAAFRKVMEVDDA